MLPKPAAAAAHYKQCTCIPSSLFGPDRNFLKASKYIALLVTTSMLNFPRNFDHPNRIKHSYSDGLPSADCF